MVPKPDCPTNLFWLVFWPVLPITSVGPHWSFSFSIVLCLYVGNTTPMAGRTHNRITPHTSVLNGHYIFILKCCIALNPSCTYSACISLKPLMLLHVPTYHASHEIPMCSSKPVRPVIIQGRPPFWIIWSSHLFDTTYAINHKQELKI